MRIFCEGKDDKEFIIQLLKHLWKNKELNHKLEYSQYFEVMNGKPKLLDSNNYSAITKKIEFEQITKILFIFDVDFVQDDNKSGGLTKSEKSIKNLITELNWGNKVADYYIFDKNLDDFIIKTLNQNQQKCFKEFDACLNIEDKNKNKKISTCIYKKLYPEKPYDFSHQNFKPLKDKLKKLFN